MTDTIAAISTGGSVSAIGIIRISGSGALRAAEAVFTARSGISVRDAIDRKLYYGELRGADGAVIDLCLCTVSRAPNSYTGEDTAELQCHGSPVVLTEGLNAVIAAGARLAKPGEFTKRAFLNGCMDLTQAEAVIDLIESETAEAAKNAAGQLAGAVRTRLDALYAELLDIIAHFHAVIDYPDEDIDEFRTEMYTTVLRKISDELNRLYSTYERGKIVKNGIPTVITGLPNAGKSSLLNALVGYDRAIVTEIPGTTRDTIEEKIRVGASTLRLIDTAGIRQTADPAEKLGVERTRGAILGAKLVLAVLDASRELSDGDLEILRSVPDSADVIAVLNKSDLPEKIHADELTHLFPNVTKCRVSAKTGDGIRELEAAIKELFTVQGEPPRGELITNARQAAAIADAIKCTEMAAEALAQRVTPDAALCEVEGALLAIGEITGKTMREDVTARIFERFCVGK